MSREFYVPCTPYVYQDMVWQMAMTGLPLVG